MNSEKISVIICTKDRPEQLERCLKSIYSSRKNYRYDEILVVDSSSDESTKKRNKDMVETINGKYIYEGRKGLSIARNTGIKNSLGDIIIFADDDFFVDPNWIKNLMVNYIDTEVMCCTGRMLPYYNDEISALYEKAMSFDRGDKRYEITKKSMSIIAIIKTIPKIGKKRLKDRTPPPFNVGYGFCSFRKDIFGIVGLFDETLGRGTPSVGSDDIDMYYRILKKGYKIVYEPTAIAYHVHRQTLDAILIDAYFAGISIRAFTKKYQTDPYVWMIFFGTLFLLIFSYIRSQFESGQLDNMILMTLKGFLHGSFKKKAYPVIQRSGNLIERDRV